MPALSSREPLALLGATGLVLVWSGVQPLERGTWWLEVAPVLIGVPLLIGAFSSFRLSPLLYRLLFLHAIILMVNKIPKWIFLSVFLPHKKKWNGRRKKNRRRA